MPTKNNEEYKAGIISDNGIWQEIKPPVEIDTGLIDVSELENVIEQINDGEDLSMDAEFEYINLSDAFGEAIHGEKIYCETSCVCDGTLYFALRLVLALKKMGCVCINVRSETVNDANPPWMNCRFIASGIMWNTNNWRKMHGISMVRKRHSHDFC